MFRERKVLCDLINEISENFEYLWNFTIENCSIEKETSIAIEYTVFNCS